MVRFWTCHWKFCFWIPENNVEGKPVCSSWSNEFSKRGVQPGDMAYIISLSGGQLYLGGRMTVKQVLSRDEYARLRDDVDSKYEADECILDPDEVTGTLLHLRRRLSPALTKRIRFQFKAGPRAPCFVNETDLDNQATRGLRELTPESAAFLDRIIEITDQWPESDQLLTVTEELLLTGPGPDVTGPSKIPDDVSKDSSGSSEAVQMTHILQTKDEILDDVFEADGTNTFLQWTFPKNASVGDTALLYEGSLGIFGRAKILSAASPADDWGWPGHYGGDVVEVRIFEMSVPLDYIRSEMPDFGWSRSPRSYTTLDESTAALLETVIADYHRDNLDLEPDGLVPAIEGARRLVYVNSYERSRSAREACKRIHKPICAACGFDFGIAYGSGFIGYIHVHHLVRLADIGEEYQVDPRTDMIPVCPNCHAVIHSQNPPLSIDAVRKLLGK